MKIISVPITGIPRPVYDEKIYIISQFFVMKSRKLIPVFIFILLITGKISYQQKPSYPLPDSYQFDYEVVQVIAGKKNTSDTNSMHYLYTKSGEYAALKMVSRKGKETLMVFTKDGTSIIFDDEKKSIMIINMKNMLGEFANMAKGMKKDSLSGHKGKFDPSRFQSAKTGNTKKIGNYTAEEYKVSDSGKYKATIWYAKVDFNAQLYYLLGMGAGNMVKMGSSGMGANPLLQTITDPKTLLTEMVSADTDEGKGINMYTKSIESISTSVSTKGYQVNDYSNMDMKQMMEEKGKRNGQ